jgi:hypothetical protein
MDKLTVLPFFRDDDYDQSMYHDEHVAIFGHEPQPGRDGSCTHELHGRIRQAAKGATIVTPFDGEAIVSEDTVLASQRQRRYNDIYRATQQFQAEVEEEEKLERMAQLGLISPRRVF